MMAYSPRILGRPDTRRYIRVLTLDQLVKVRILLRQPKKHLQIADKEAVVRRLVRIFVLQPNCYGAVRDERALAERSATSS
jgi:hypothetical protein